MKKKANSKMAAKADNAVKFSKADYQEMIADARAELIASGIKRPTSRQVQAQIEANLGGKVAQKAARSTKVARHFIFGFSVAAVARALGRASVMPSDAIAAIHSHQPKASPFAIRTYVQAGRAGVRGAPAKLTAQQLKSLKAVAA
jgi:hypothetical protein